MAEQIKKSKDFQYHFNKIKWQSEAKASQ